MAGSSTALPQTARAARATARPGRRARGLLAALCGFSLLAACREQVPLAQQGGDAGAVGAAEATGSGDTSAAGEGGAAAAGGQRGNPESAGAGGDRAAAEAGPELVVCPTRQVPDACSLSGDSSKGVRLIGTLLEPGATRQGGVLDIDAAGTIRCAACDCGDAGGALVIDCPGLIIAPGFINLHDHLGYAGTPPLPHPGEQYEHRNDWRLGENGHDALPFSGSASTAEVLAQELRMVMGGATSILGAGGKRGFLRNLDAPALTEGLLPGLIRSETFPLDDAIGIVNSAACQFGESPDTTALTLAASAYVAHVGEGNDQRAEDELRCALGSLNLLGENSAVVHAMALTRADAGNLAARGASVIWSPRSNLDLYGNTAPVALLGSLGVHIALGTDWLASGSMNLLRELACAQSYNQSVLGGYFSASELVRMVTAEPAWALRIEGKLGALGPGLVGDVAVFREHGADPYQSVVEAEAADVRLVLRQGQPLYGAGQLIEAFEAGDGCDELVVCGATQRVCATETGLSLAEIREAGEAVYPLFSCGAPEGEPHCEAVVTQECPKGERHCEPPAALTPLAERDADQDGVPDLIDGCPRVADAEQGDADSDGRGDGCDPCPLENAGLLPCPVSIASLRAPGSRLALRTAVVVSDARVTAVRLQGSKGFYLEDGDRAPYSGIFAYTETTNPSVATLEQLDLQGYFDSFQGSDQLVQTQVLAHAPGAAYEPLSVLLADAADGSAKANGLASLFVRIDDVEVELTNPDAPNDYDETQLLGGLRLDDLIAPDLDNGYPVGTKFSSIQGILGFSFGHQKLFPIKPQDLVIQ